MKKILSIAVALLLCATAANAQFLKKLKDKITDAAKQSTEKAMDKAVYKTVSKPIDKATDKVMNGGVGKSTDNGSAKKTKTANKTEDFVVIGQNAPKIGSPCSSKEEVSKLLGQYVSAAEYPWPAARAEYFKKLNSNAEKAKAKSVLEQIEKLEQQSRSDFKLAGGIWEATYSSQGYQYVGNTKLADYRFQVGLYSYLCIDNKVRRNDEYSTVLRTYVNTFPLQTWSKYLRHIAKTKDISLTTAYAYKDWKNYKNGAVAPTIDIMNYLECSNLDLIKAINEGTAYWEEAANENSGNTEGHLFRYWFVKKPEPILVPVSRREYLESLLEYYVREEMYLPKSTNYELGSKESRLQYFGDLNAVLGNKKAIVNKLLKEKDQQWLAKQAVINTQEDEYLNQKLQLPDYSSNLTFHKFYDNEKLGVPVYKYNPSYFKGNLQNTATPMFMTVVFRYTNNPTSLRILNNFSANFREEAWRKQLSEN